MCTAVRAAGAATAGIAVVGTTLALATGAPAPAADQSTAWTPTKTQIRSALAQERYYMSFGRAASARQPSPAWTPTQTQIRSALAQERYYMSFGGP
jgi:hypothetical protein